MKRVWSGATLVDTAHLKNLLEQAGIGSFIKNTYLGSAIGELPVYDSGPELWVLKETDAPRAETLLRDAMQPATTTRIDTWRCASCGESVEGQFAACWRCGSSDSAA